MGREGAGDAAPERDTAPRGSNFLTFTKVLLQLLPWSAEEGVLHTDRQTQRKTHTEIHKDTHRHRNTGIHTDTETDRHTHRDRQTQKHRDRHMPTDTMQMGAELSRLQVSLKHN